MSKSDKLGRKTALIPTERARLETMAANLGRGKSLRTKITWPGGTAEIELRILASDERQAAEVAALKETQDVLGSEDVPRNIAREHLAESETKHIMAAACMQPGTDDKFFASRKELGSIAFDSEVAAVYKLYQDHCSLADPSLDELSEEQLEVITESIKKKAAGSLKNIASELPRSSLLTLVNLLADSLMDSSTNT